VVDAESRTPIARAEIALIDFAERELRRTLSDSVGAFFMRLPAEGSYVLRVSHLAYARYASDPLTVDPAESVTLEIRLGRSAIPLEPIVVTARSSTRLAEFHQRRLTNAFGRFLTEEEIDRRAPLQTSDLLRGIPGIALSPVRARGRTVTRITLPSAAGRCEPAFWVDGVRLAQTGDPVDDILGPGTVAGIEVYSSTAGAPAQYADTRGCGTILFWTKEGERDEGRAFSWKRTMIGLGGALLVVLLIR
jgi:hypothetical protein